VERELKKRKGKKKLAGRKGGRTEEERGKSRSKTPLLRLGNQKGESGVVGRKGKRL